MSEARPNLVILAGPNGAGKSTAAPELLQGALGVNEFVNADVIARGLSAFDPDSAAIGAGRVMLSRVRELAEQRVSFAFETTLASRTFRNFFRLYEPLASTWRRCTTLPAQSPSWWQNAWSHSRAGSTMKVSGRSWSVREEHENGHSEGHQPHPG